MSIGRKCFETKSISGYHYFDYWDLQTHPLFIAFNRKEKPLCMHFDEVPFEGCTKVTNLTDIRDVLYRNRWAFKERYWKIFKTQIQTMINIPWTQL
jgi:hypothetical protein